MGDFAQPLQQQNSKAVQELTNSFSKIAAANQQLMLRAHDVITLKNLLASEDLTRPQAAKTAALGRAVEEAGSAFRLLSLAHSSRVRALQMGAKDSASLTKNHDMALNAYNRSIATLLEKISQYGSACADKAVFEAFKFAAINAALAVGFVPALLAGCKPEEKKKPPQASAEGQFLQNYKSQFKSVLSAPPIVSAQKTIVAIDAAHEMLADAQLSDNNEEAVVVARIENGKLTNLTTIFGTRPEEGGAQWHFGEGMRFGVSRLPSFDDVPTGKNGKIDRKGGINYDIGKNYAELRISRADAKGETWVALAVKLRENYAGSKGDFILTPYCPLLASGEMASFGLGYLSSLDSQARIAIKKYGQQAVGESDAKCAELDSQLKNLSSQRKKLNLRKHKSKINQINSEIARISLARKEDAQHALATKEVLTHLERIPNDANMSIALIEAVDVQNLTQDSFRYDVSRFLYNVAANRNQAKLLTVSGASARGLFQFTGATVKNFDSKYGDMPLEVFRRWSGDSIYSPEGWVTRENRMSDAMYSSIFALFHHADVLNSARYSGISESSLYSDSTQTMCSIASGFNGGVNNLRKRISDKTIKGVQSWDRNAFSYGIQNLAKFKENSNENLGYIVKTPIVLSALAGEKIEPVELASCVLPSSHHNSSLALVGQKKTRT